MPEDAEGGGGRGAGLEAWGAKVSDNNCKFKIIYIAIVVTISHKLHKSLYV
jgi:hypothetical protein